MDNFIKKRIDIKIFFIALGIGLFYCYLFTPRPKIIFEHPNPNNLDNVYFDKKQQTCYKYNAEKVKCTKDSIEK